MCGEKHPPAAAMQGCPGITPAYAGKRRVVLDYNAVRWDHPRVCGEKCWSCEHLRGRGGSPPRMRGKVRLRQGFHLCDGITPACAGKSEKTRSITTTRRDHPRVCGEKPRDRRVAAGRAGSPPRMRGKAGRGHGAAQPHGITPAYAGKSARRQAGPPGPAPPPQMRLGWSPPPCTGRQCRTRKSTHARRARIPVPAHTPAPQ